MLFKCAGKQVPVGPNVNLGQTGVDRQGCLTHTMSSGVHPGNEAQTKPRARGMYGHLPVPS